MSGVATTVARQMHWTVRGGVVRPPDGRSVAIDVDPVVIGRDPGATLLVEDRRVSAFHCELRAVHDGILVRDLGSTNGTRVGTFRVTEGLITTPTELVVGGPSVMVEPATSTRRVETDLIDRFGPLVGSTPKMRRVFGVLERVAPTQLSVLVLGETGTGKELAARALHDNSPRKDGPFVVVDCGSIPPTLAESILFGHEKGAFTGATERRNGALREAHGGTLFLDELGELPIDLQPKLLRALAERQVKRVGGSAFEPIDVRLVAATRRDLSAEMNADRFRSDLYFRIAQVRVELAPLRERRADIADLVADVCARAGRPQHAGAVVDWIERRMDTYDWPGNVRELVNVASVAATLADTPEAIDDVFALTREAPEGARYPVTAFAAAKKKAVHAWEKDYFLALSEQCGGNVSEMARRSGIERHHVRAFLRKYGIHKA